MYGRPPGKPFLHTTMTRSISSRTRTVYGVLPLPLPRHHLPPPRTKLTVRSDVSATQTLLAVMRFSQTPLPRPVTEERQHTLQHWSTVLAEDASITPDATAAHSRTYLHEPPHALSRWCSPRSQTFKRQHHQHWSSPTSSILMHLDHGIENQGALVSFLGELGEDRPNTRCRRYGSRNGGVEYENAERGPTSTTPFTMLPHPLLDPWKMRFSAFTSWLLLWCCRGHQKATSAHG